MDEVRIQAGVKHGKLNFIDLFADCPRASFRLDSIQSRTWK